MQTLHKSKIELSYFAQVGNFRVEGKRERAIYIQQSARTGKANKMVRCAAIAENMPDIFERVVRAANRAEYTENRASAQRDERRAKRAK